MKKYRPGFFTTSKKKHTYHGIDFKSDIELRMYKYLEHEGYDVQYENSSICIFPSEITTVPFYTKNTKGQLVKKNPKLLPIRYTPDFIFHYKHFTIYIECKGYETPEFKMRFKLFRKHLETLPNKKDFIIAEVYTMKQLEQFLEYLKYY